MVKSHHASAQNRIIKLITRHTSSFRGTMPEVNEVIFAALCLPGFDHHHVPHSGQQFRESISWQIHKPPGLLRGHFTAIDSQEG